jgi:IrrE N-terminal-like domain
MLTDHKVRPRTFLQIKEIARDIRSKLCGDGVGGVRAANAILRLTNEVQVEGQSLKLELRSSKKIGAPAVVSYRPLKVEFDRAIWTKALLSKDGPANYIAGHELGHIVMHNHDAQPFSGVKKEWIDFQEQSAEWQANKFAACFLVTDREIEHYISPDVLSQICMVPLDVAERQFLEIAQLAETCCQECCGTKVYRVRSDHFCWTCRKSFM